MRYCKQMIMQSIMVSANLQCELLKLEASIPILKRFTLRSSIRTSALMYLYQYPFGLIPVKAVAA